MKTLSVLTVLGVAPLLTACSAGDIGELLVGLLQLLTN